MGVTVDGAPITIGAPRQRALLALLLLDANRPLHPHALIDGIWGDAIPQHPDAALQIVVSRLRNALGCVADRLTSESGGYRIEAGDDELDLLRARRKFSRAQELSEQNDFAGAAACADASLACWTGETFVDLRDAPFYDAAYREIRELRFAIYELRNRAYLGCGRHVEVLEDIDTWVRSEPWRERIRAHHMVALYRAGRRVEALAVYDDLARCLADDLRVDPSRYMQELRARVVEQDPTLLAARSGIASPLPTWTSLALPFVGREREEIVIFDRLREIAAGGRRMILVEGEAGIGKSRLVVEAARRARDEAIVLAVDGADALRPGLHALANALAKASFRISDTELRLCLGRWPGDVADLVPALRRRLPGLPSALEADDELRAARLRVAAVSWIAGLSQRAPVVLLLDDVHRAGPATLLFLDALMTTDESSRVLVLATARSGASDTSSRLEHLLRVLRRRGALDRIELHGLQPLSVKRLLTDLAFPDAANRACELSRITHGHPYLLGEMLRDRGLDGPPAGDADVTGRIRQFVVRRVAGLGEPVAQLLGIAAALDGEFDVALLSELSRGTTRSTEMLLDEAIGAGLVHVSDLGSFDFVHDLARRAIIEAIDGETRARSHREIALVLERRGADCALVASQWCRAGGDDADIQTIAWSQRAAEAALRDLDPHAAAAWFRVAADRAEDPRTRAGLLTRLAATLCQVGEEAAGDALREALDIARRLDDSELFVAAATIPTPIWASMPTLSRPERVEVLTEGTRRTTVPGVRAQLRARLAHELMFTPEWSVGRELADEALCEARLAGDASVLPEVLMRHAQVTCTPYNLEERRRNAEEAVALTAAGHDPIQHFFALSTAASASIEAVQVDEADVYVEAACALGRELDVPHLAYNTECMRSWRAGLAGDLEGSERLALSAVEIGARGRVANAAIGPALQISWLRWQQGRFAELLPILGDPGNDETGALILRARALACFGDKQVDAAAVLVKAASNGFEDLPAGLLWAGTLIAAAEAAFMLGDPHAGRLVHSLLEPFADQATFNGCWVLAPIAYGAALAAAAARDRVCDELFECSLAVSRRLRAPVLLARTQMAWSRVLIARGGDPAKVISLVDDAQSTFVAHGVDTIARSAQTVLREAELDLAARS